jgi:hypothetical protein
MECTANYLASGKCDDGHGWNPDSFLFEMAKTNFAGRWPARAGSDRKLAAAPSPKKSTPAEEEAALRWIAEHDPDQVEREKAARVLAARAS